jgi:hypothetical protein
MGVEIAAAITTQVDVLRFARCRRSHATVDASAAGRILAILARAIGGSAPLRVANAMRVRRSANCGTVAIAICAASSLSGAIRVDATREHTNIRIRADRIGAGLLNAGGGRFAAVGGALTVRRGNHWIGVAKQIAGALGIAVADRSYPVRIS